MGMSAVLTDFERLLAERAAPIHNLLATPGPEPAYVERVLAQRWDVAPAEVVAWFSWHNGWRVRPPGVTEGLIGPWHPLTIDEAVAEADRVMERASPRLQAYYPSAWLPVVEVTGSGQRNCQLIIDLSGGPHAVLRDPWGEPPQPVATSLRQVVEGWVSLLRLDVVRWNDESESWSYKTGFNDDDPRGGLLLYSGTYLDIPLY